MRVLITGGERGQLNYELRRSLPEHIQQLVPEQRLDFSRPADIRPAVDALRPDAVINAAAYTAVDKAESEEHAALQVNAVAVEQLALACHTLDIPLLHVSTDFVFSATEPQPLQPASATAPINAYGRTKLAGEYAVLNNMERGLVVRTAWVYSAHGNNFVKTMLRLMRERGEVGVVADQIGSPTWARTLAQLLWQCLDEQVQSQPDRVMAGTLDQRIVHWCGSGVASWYDFAVAIAEEACAIGLLEDMPVVRPLTSEQFPTPAKRPAYSVLDCRASYERFELEPVLHWRADLRCMLSELLSSSLIH